MSGLKTRSLATACNRGAVLWSRGHIMQIIRSPGSHSLDTPVPNQINKLEVACCSSTRSIHTRKGKQSELLSGWISLNKRRLFRLVVVTNEKGRTVDWLEVHFSRPFQLGYYQFKFTLPSIRPLNSGLLGIYDEPTLKQTCLPLPYMVPHTWIPS